MWRQGECEKARASIERQLHCSLPPTFRQCVRLIWRYRMAASIDQLITQSLTRFCADAFSQEWFGKEHDWVNRYVFGYLIKCCEPSGVLHDPAQIGIEVGVPQPPGYVKKGVLRDVVIRERPTTTCWDAQWGAVNHPLAILEWKVHRPRHRNREVAQEREWLRRYCAWQKATIGYAVEIDMNTSPMQLSCCRFEGDLETHNWLKL